MQLPAVGSSKKATSSGAAKGQQDKSYREAPRFSGALPAVGSPNAKGAHLKDSKEKAKLGGRRQLGQRKGGARNQGAHSGLTIRPDSRVGKVLTEFGSKGDWVSQTILRHQMAVVIQSIVRGWIVRRHWAKEPSFVVNDLKQRIKSEAAEVARRKHLREQLHQRLLTGKQKETASAALEAMFGDRGPGFKPAKAKPTGTLMGKWGKLSTNVDIAKAGVVAAAEGNGDFLPGNATDSDFSDEEVNLATVKQRARTPPWQRVEHGQWVGQYQKLQNKQSRGKIDVLWDTGECASRLEDVAARRKAREAEDDSDYGEDEFDPATDDLPTDVVKDLLSEKYYDKWKRLGLDTYQPVQYGKLDVGLVEEGPMKLTAVRLGLEDLQKYG